MGYIKSISLNEFNGSFNQKIEFFPGFNIITGVNGTGKTTVLKQLKAQFNNSSIVKLEGEVTKVLAISPKRNAEKKSVLSALTYIKQQNRTSDNVLTEAQNRAISDNTFERYESFGDLYSYEFQDRCKSGGDQILIMDALTEEYNTVLKSIFPEYDIRTTWNSQNGYPDVKLVTKYGIPLDLTYMSCGESEILALIFNIYFNKNSFDIFLIDEPEIHLNWSLEKGLFKFFDQFSINNNKQIIVTSHSRIIFDNQFKSKTQFLVFRDNKVVVEQNPPREVIENIAGETISLISVSAPSIKTFFVEDLFHKCMIESLLKTYNRLGDSIAINNASGMIISFYKILKENSEINSKYVNAYLMIDGDGTPEQFKEEKRFIHLKRFTAESYCFDIPIMAKVLNITQSKLKSEIIHLMKNDPCLSKGPKSYLISKLLIHLNPSSLNINLMSNFDCSDLLHTLLKKHNIKWADYLEKYLDILKLENKLLKIFDKKLIKAIKSI